MTRRHFLSTCIAASAATKRPPKSILVHEHVLVDFIDAKDYTEGRYDREDVVRVALPKLKEIAELGCVRMHECTPNFLGRDPILLQRLSKESGIELWTNTGLYAARDRRHIPEYGHRESAAELAKRWIDEARNGLAGGVRPRFIKIGVNKGPLHALDRKIVEAAVLTSKETGLVICSHTGDGKAALEQLEIVRAGKLRPAKFVWVHAQNELDLGIHERMARAGAWVEFDGIGKPTADWHLRCVRHMAEKRLLNQVLISQDAGWYSVGQPGGGNFRGYSYILQDFAPRLASGQREKLLWKNPLRCFGS